VSGEEVSRGKKEKVDLPPEGSVLESVVQYVDVPSQAGGLAHPVYPAKSADHRDIGIPSSMKKNLVFTISSRDNGRTIAAGD
jgi:hypothetical protein